MPHIKVAVEKHRPFMRVSVLQWGVRDIWEIRTEFIEEFNYTNHFGLVPSVFRDIEATGRQACVSQTIFVHHVSRPGHAKPLAAGNSRTRDHAFHHDMVRSDKGCAGMPLP